MFRILIAVTVCTVAFSSTANAGRLFKCVGSDGVTSYQQSECPKAATEAGVVDYQREPDAPETGWLGQQIAQEQAAARNFAISQPTQQIEQPAPRRRAPSINPMSAEAEMIRRAEHRSRTPEGRAVNRALYGQASPTHSPPPTAPHPTTVTDQHGNRYQQPPGSVFVTEERTGRQCFKNGDFLHCQ